LPLYSQAKWRRFHTSAKPSPPAALPAPFSKAYHSPVGSASFGVGTPSTRQRSMKCSCAAALSFAVLSRHFAANSAGVMGPAYRARMPIGGVTDPDVGNGRVSNAGATGAGTHFTLVSGHLVP
jgi:hypothetical protein